jgi:hypothetical protein
MLIAVSSFGESLRRVLPHRPGGGDLNRKVIVICYYSPCEVIGGCGVAAKPPHHNPRSQAIGLPE